jgi:copper(I)-binding protein
MNLFRRGGRSLAGVAILIIAAAFAIGGCAASAPSASASTVAIANAWVRPASAGGTSAAYLTINNTGATADTLLAVHCTIAGSVMLHETSTDASGMTGMDMIESLPVPAGGSVTLAPGGTHVMIGGLTRSIAAGEQIQLEFVFQHAGTIRVAAGVRAG